MPFPISQSSRPYRKLSKGGSPRTAPWSRRHAGKRDRVIEQAGDRAKPELLYHGTGPVSRIPGLTLNFPMAFSTTCFGVLESSETSRGLRLAAAIIDSFEGIICPGPVLISKRKPREPCPIATLASKESPKTVKFFRVAPMRGAPPRGRIESSFDRPERRKWGATWTTTGILPGTLRQS